MPTRATWRAWGQASLHDQHRNAGMLECARGDRTKQRRSRVGGVEKRVGWRKLRVREFLVVLAERPPGKQASAITTALSLPSGMSIKLI